MEIIVAHTAIIRQSLIPFDVAVAREEHQSRGRDDKCLDGDVRQAHVVRAPLRYPHREMTILRGVTDGAFNRDVLSRKTHLYSFATPTRPPRPARTQ